MSKMLQGKVVKKSGKNTVAVLVERPTFHRLYKKRYTLSRKFLADCPTDGIEIGQLVTIVEGRPISKRKKFRVVK